MNPMGSREKGEKIMAQFLTYYADTPYLITVTDSQDMMTMRGRLADDDFVGAQPWQQVFPTDMVAEIGAEALAEQMAGYYHIAAAGRRLAA